MTISGTISSLNINGNVITNDITGKLNIPQVSGSITYSPTIIVNPYGPEATALFNRMTVQPSTTLKQLIDKTINDLKTAGIWQITDKFHKWDLHTEQASLLDWKNSIHDATNINGASFAPGYGLSTTRYVNYLNLNFIPSIDCNQASLNDIGYSLDDLTMEETLGMNFGAQSSGSSIALTFRTVEIGALRPWALVNAATWKVWNGAAGQFLYYAQRNNNTTIQIYKDANTVTSGNSTSEAMINQSLLLGGYMASSGIPVIHNISTSTLWLGKSFTAEQRASWYDIINYWKANIGTATEEFYGIEKVRNGGFDTTDRWITTAGWNIDNGVASCDGTVNNSLYQDVNGENGKRYKIEVTITDYESGILMIGGSTNALSANGNGTYKYIRTWTSDSILYLKSHPSSGFKGSIDNISVKELL